jgi:putative heme-binding domain-containing protein
VNLTCFAALALAGATFAQNVPRDGERLYGSYCGHCHGAAGEGARGPALARQRLTRAPDEASFERIVTGGIPDTEMPPSRLSGQEIRSIRAYLLRLGSTIPETVKGDAAHGRVLFAGKGGCLRCHTVNGEGGRIGPELSSIGMSRSAARLRIALIEPEAEVPDNFAQYRMVIPMPDNFVMVRLKTKDGREVHGIRLNEDPFSIQVRDLEDRLHSFLKQEVAEISKDARKSPMPGFRNLLTETELADLVAYLQSLRERR